jgi:hypothetical protein
MGTMMVIGLGIALAGFTLGILHFRRVGRYAREHKVGRLTAMRALGAGLDWCNVVLWPGLALVASGQAVDQIQNHREPAVILMSLPSGVFFILICGFYLGRLHMRFERRRDAAAADAEADGWTSKA